MDPAGYSKDSRNMQQARPFHQGTSEIEVGLLTCSTLNNVIQRLLVGRCGGANLAT